MTLRINWPGGGGMVVDLGAVLTEMNSREQKKIFKELGNWISDEDCQSALHFIAERITESRQKAAADILAGTWPVTPPIPAAALDRFADSMLPIVMSVCTIPEVARPEEKEK